MERMVMSLARRNKSLFRAGGGSAISGSRVISGPGAGGSSSSFFSTQQQQQEDPVLNIRDTAAHVRTPFFFFLRP
jgi:hypothetical protein